MVFVAVERMYLMGDESFTPATGGFLFKANSNGVWENVGYVNEDAISYVSDSDEEELELWQGKLSSLNDETVTIALRPEWWSLNRLYKLATGRYRYTVPSLRRDNKGHRRNRCK